MRLALAALALALPIPALAGGLGLMATGGGHSDRVYYYTYDDLTESYTQQEPMDYMGLDFGGGIEAVLGDRDNRVLGVFRAYYIQDAPQKEPEATGGETLVYNIRSEPRPVGMVNAGVQFGVLGDPANLQFIIVGTLGSGFLTTDWSEFLTAEVGVGGTYMLARNVQLAATVNGGTRYRKLFSPTVNGTLALRYLFD